MSTLNQQLESSLQIVPEKRLTVAPAQNEWERKLALVQHTVAPGLNKDEFELFCHVAKTRNLDPLQRQIHAVKRRTWNGETRSWEEKLTIQIGIDGFRAIANRTGLYMPSEKPPLIEDTDDQLKMRATVWVKKYHPASRTWNEFGVTAYYREFVQTKKDKDSNTYQPVAMWAKMPLSMTEKCAEAKALRRGWPEDLGGIYIPEEMTSDAPPVLEAAGAMDSQAISDYLASIESSGDIDELKRRYKEAQDKAEAAKDHNAATLFSEKKNDMYRKLAKGAK